MKRIKEMFMKLWIIARNPMVRVLPGQIAFFLVLAIFPILILLGLICSFFSIDMGTITNVISDSFPKDVVDLLIPLLSGKGFDTNVGISMITGFIIASNGAHSIILASNTLYGFPHADIIKRRVKALFIIILMICLFIFTLLVLAFGDIIMKYILDFLSSDRLAKTIYKLFILLRWPFAMFIMFFNVKLIYTLAPDWKILSRYTTKGAVFTTVGWILATMIYSYYATHFSNYDFFYGGLSSIVVLMIWIYALSYILVIGIAINVNVYQNIKEEE